MIPKPMLWRILVFLWIAALTGSWAFTDRGFCGAPLSGRIPISVISNEPTHGAESHPAVAFNSGFMKDYLVVWDQLSPGGGASVIYGQFMNRDGKKNGIGVPISPEFGYNQYPAVAYNPALDQYFVVYEVLGAGIYGQIVNNTGTPVLPEMNIIDTTGGTPRKPAVIFCSGSGQYLVVWQADSGTAKAIAARVIHADGTVAPGSPLAITGWLDLVEPAEPDVAYNSALDQALVVWQQWATPGATQRNIYGQIIALTGGARLEGPAIPIHESADDEMNPAVAGLPISAGAGGYLVVCQRWYGMSSMIDGRTVDSGGGGLGSWVGISPFSGFVPAVAANENSREYLVAWAADNQTLQARTVSADGLHLSSYSQLSGLFLSHPAIAGGPLGDYLVTFDDLFTSGYTYDIFGWLWGTRVFLPAVLKN